MLLLGYPAEVQVLGVLNKELSKTRRHIEVTDKSRFIESEDSTALGRMEWAEGERLNASVSGNEGLIS